MNRPTCLAALENFESGHKNNFIQFQSSKYDQILLDLRKSLIFSQKKILCYNGLKLLKDSAQIFPLGKIEFSILVRPAFTGWKMDSLFQLDLSELQSSTPK